MTEVTEVKTDWTPAELAAEIAFIVRNKTKHWGQGSYFGGIDWSHIGSERIGKYWYRAVPAVKLREALKPEATCGATACIAGWAAVLTAPLDARIDAGDAVIYPDGKSRGAWSIGKEVLALTEDQASWLFEARRTEEEVLTTLDAIAAGEDWVTPDEPNDEDDYEGGLYED